MRLLLLILFFMQLGGCASILHGRHQKITVTSHPTGAIVYCEGGEYRTPCSIMLERKEDHVLSVSHGSQAHTYQISSKLSAAVFGNILAGGLVGIVIDGASGAAGTLKPNKIHVDFYDNSKSTEQGRNSP